MTTITSSTSPGSTFTVKSAVAYGTQGVQLASLDDAWRFSQYIIASGLAPRGLEKPEAILVAMQLGAELGLTPMASLQNIAVINGRPGIFGDAALALVRASGLIESYREEEVGSRLSDDWGFKVTTTRKGMPEHADKFTVADAKLAKLWGKTGPWSEYPRRMLKWRARGYVLRDIYGDVLKGLRTTEELHDTPVEPKNVSPLKGLVAALDAPKEPETPTIVPEPVPETPKPRGRPPKVQPAPTEAEGYNRPGVVMAIESHMLALNVSEARVWQYAQEAYPEACVNAEKLWDLPTNVLAKIKDVVPELAV